MPLAVTQLSNFLARTQSLVVLSGAGVSTGSGIPDYRDRNGNWKHAQPIQYGDFLRSSGSRKRYWQRSYLGWRRFSAAQPNTAHHALAALEATGKVDTLITQNVDGLHRRAGSRSVIDLHGDLSQIRCVSCDKAQSRADYQQRLAVANPTWETEVFRYRPDGDAEVAELNQTDFIVPACTECDGVVKPDVVMFGESVPKTRVAEAMAAVDRAEALLVVGSSLTVFSGFRFARAAKAQQKPIAILNLGRTRADELATLKIDADCSPVLASALEVLAA